MTSLYELSTVSMRNRRKFIFFKLEIYFQESFSLNLFDTSLCLTNFVLSKNTLHEEGEVRFWSLPLSSALLYLNEQSITFTQIQKKSGEVSITLYR